MRRRKTDLITEEIRKIVKMGDRKMAWARINQLKNNKEKPLGNIILWKNDGALTRKYNEPSLKLLYKEIILILRCNA